MGSSKSKDVNMKIGRNDPCPCGSGKKYKKCCLGKDSSSKTESQSHYYGFDADEDEDEDEDEWEMIASMYNNFRSRLLGRKPHIKEYKKIRRIHSEIVDSMIDYYQNGKFELKVDHTYQPDAAPERKDCGESQTVYFHELEFDMESDRGVQAFFDVMIYKASPNLNCITEDFIKSRRYRSPEKIEFLQSMLESRLGLFEVIEKDFDEGYARIKDVLNKNEYTLIDMGLSSGINSDNMLLYTRIITYRGISFGTGLSLTFSKNDSFIKSFIKRRKADYHSFGEYGRFVELYQHFCRTPNEAKIISNKF